MCDMDNMPSPGFEEPGERSTHTPIAPERAAQSDEIKAESGKQYIEIRTTTCQMTWVDKSRRVR